MYYDIQFGKGKPRNPQKMLVTFTDTGDSLEVMYRITPCAGVKLCGETGCSYVTSAHDCKPKHNSKDLACAQWSLYTSNHTSRQTIADGWQGLCVTMVRWWRKITSTITPFIFQQKFLVVSRMTSVKPSGRIHTWQLQISVKVRCATHCNPF